MERKGIVNGVNQAGRAPAPEDPNSRARFRKDNGNALVSTLMSILSAFANVVSPLKDEKRRK